MSALHSLKGRTGKGREERMEEISCAASYTAPGPYPEIRVEGKTLDVFQKLSQEKGEAAGTVPQKIGIRQMPA